MLSEKLKEATQANHQQLEKVLVGKLKAIRSVQGYADVLKVFYCYFGGLELLIDKAIDGAMLPDNAERRKSQSLSNDLKFLGEEIPAKAISDDLPTVNSHLQALGALYVIEGSTLGGKIISKMMQQQLELDGQAISFFTSYGDRIQQMWDTFKDALNRQAQNPEQEAVIIAAANETFLKFGKWFEKSEE